jgi:hypothetical protein
MANMNPSGPSTRLVNWTPDWLSSRSYARVGLSKGGAASGA